MDFFPVGLKIQWYFQFTWLEQNEQISLVVFNGCIFFVLVLDGSNAFEMMNGSYVVYMRCIYRYIYVYIQSWLMFWKRLKSNTNCQQNRLTKWTPTSCSLVILRMQKPMQISTNKNPTKYISRWTISLARWTWIGFVVFYLI